MDFLHRQKKEKKTFLVIFYTSIQIIDHVQSLQSSNNNTAKEKKNLMSPVIKSDLEENC